MAETLLVKTTAPGPYSKVGAAVTMAAGDVANGNYVPAGGLILLVVQNTDGATPYWVNIASSVDPFGRTGDVAQQDLAAGEIRIFLLPALGWQNAAGRIIITVENAAIELGWTVVG